MPKRNVSRSSIPVPRGKKHLYVKIINTNMEGQERTLYMNAYDKNQETDESLPIYLKDELKHKDTLKPGEEKVYKIDVTNVDRKVVFECIQMKGSSGLKVSSKNKGSVNAVIRIK